MPSSKGYKRNYKQEYAEYQSQHNADRAMRNKAHGMLEKALGVNITQDVDHKTPIVKGGTNDLSNLRVLSQSQNRSFPRTKKARMK
jgi:5-methylcytosine-specific restriction endonuclease McrA